MILKYTLGHYPVHGFKSHTTILSEKTLNKQEHVNTIEEIKK